MQPGLFAQIDEILFDVKMCLDSESATFIFKGNKKKLEQEMQYILNTLLSKPRYQIDEDFEKQTQSKGVLYRVSVNLDSTNELVNMFCYLNKMGISIDETLKTLLPVRLYALTLAYCQNLPKLYTAAQAAKEKNPDTLPPVVKENEPQNSRRYYCNII